MLVPDWTTVPISTHAPRTGSDRRSGVPAGFYPAFQPTLPARGATRFHARLVAQPAFQPTLPARGATGFANHSGCSNIFQPTLPARGATENREATRNGSWHFNPRSPHGERPLFVSFLQICAGFQPTLPARGATDAPLAVGGHLMISTHAPRTGSDDSQIPHRLLDKHFNPRSPHGERHYGIRLAIPISHNFNPRSPHGERHSAANLYQRIKKFQPTLPARGATSSP